MLREYHIFIANDAGAFGQLKRVFLVDDGAALQVGKRLLQCAPGVDIWRRGQRVALLTAS